MARHKCKANWSPRWLTVFLLAVAVALPVGWAVAQSPSTDSDSILGHLNAAISWYRHIAGLDVTAGEPSDALYLENARNSASQALQLAFQASQAQAALAAQGKSGGAASEAVDSNNPSPSTQQHNIAKAMADASDRIQQNQAKLDELNKQLDAARGKTRQQLLSQRDALQDALNLDKMIQDALQKVASVVKDNDNGASGLAGQINQLKQSVPEVFAVNNKQDGQSSQGSKAGRAASSGLFGQASILFSQMRDIHDIDQLMAETARLRSTVDKLDAPLRDSLKGLIRQGRDIINQPAVTDPAQIAAKRQSFEALTAQFKHVADAAVPLRQEIILLDQCHGNLLEWRNSISAEYGRVLRSLLIRVAGILVALGMVFILSELWRRATYRYIHETRRRRQLMLVRRFVIGFLMVLVIVLGFISEFSSLATFAGFITAGIALALQTVILSVAAYFFLIGRYGVRVGDRLTIGGVTGDVFDIGLVRLSMMELAGTGLDLYPTGRVVVFSNAVMFQPAPFFKQLPGTAYAWHEVAVTLAPDSNHALAERSLMDAVTSIYEKYRHSIDRQHSVVERLLDASIPTPVPKAHLHFIEAGLEFVVRYPVEIPRAGEIDDEMTRKLMETINSTPELKAAVSGTPTLRAAIKA